MNMFVWINNSTASPLRCQSSAHWCYPCRVPNVSVTLPFANNERVYNVELWEPVKSSLWLSAQGKCFFSYVHSIQRHLLTTDASTNTDKMANIALKNLTWPWVRFAVLRKLPTTTPPPTLDGLCWLQWTDAIASAFFVRSLLPVPQKRCCVL